MVNDAGQKCSISNFILNNDMSEIKKPHTHTYTHKKTKTKMKENIMQNTTDYDSRSGGALWCLP